MVIDEMTYRRLAGRVKLLSWLSLGWMTVEGAVAIVAGIVASSVALVGFGLDSGIEGFASVIIIWRFTGQRMLSHAAEQRAQKLVAIQFFIRRPTSPSNRCARPGAASMPIRASSGSPWPQRRW